MKKIDVKIASAVALSLVSSTADRDRGRWGSKAKAPQYGKRSKDRAKVRAAKAST